MNNTGETAVVAATSNSSTLLVGTLSEKSSSHRQHSKKHGGKKKAAIVSKKTSKKLLHLQNRDIDETESTTNSSSQYSSPSLGRNGSFRKSFTSATSEHSSVSSDGGAQGALEQWVGGIKEKSMEKKFDTSPSSAVTGNAPPLVGESDLDVQSSGASSVAEERISLRPVAYSLPEFPKMTSSMSCFKKQPQKWNNLKIYFIGDSKVGKSCYINRVHSGVYLPGLPETKGVDFKTKSLSLGGGGEQLKIQLWDMNTMSEVITRSYYKGAHAFAVMFDVKNRDSFQNATTRWMDYIKQFASTKVPVVLVGSKVDEASCRTVTSEEAFEWCQQMDLCYIEISSELNHHVDELVELLTALAVEGMRDNAHDSSFMANTTNNSSFCGKIDEETESVASMSTANNELELEEGIDKGVKCSSPAISGVRGVTEGGDSEVDELVIGLYEYGVSASVHASGKAYESDTNHNFNKVIESASASVDASNIESPSMSVISTTRDKSESSVSMEVPQEGLKSSKHKACCILC